MQLSHHPELLDRLAAAYAQGSLRGGARRRFETLAREQPAIRAAALLWQGRWSALVELQPAVVPPPELWPRIAAQLPSALAGAPAAAPRPRATPTSLSTGWRWLEGTLAGWRLGALAGGCAAVLALAVGLQQHQRLQQGQQAQSAQRAQIAQLQQQLQAQPQIRYVAVLVDAKAQASMLVTFDAQHQRLELQRVGAYQEAADRSLQLWALPAGGQPQSLGVLGRERLLQLTAAEPAVQAVPALAISLEPAGGVPSAGGPTGPVLFSGALIAREL